MLVLSRKKHQSVIIGDEITLTVEAILGIDDGQPISGTSVRLGFQAPQHITIYRKELCAKRSGIAHAGGEAQRTQQPRGRLIDIPDAQIRLRIQVPQKVPVCHNGTPIVGIDLIEKSDGETHNSKAVHHVTCHKDDQIAICNNIIIATLDFNRFAFSEHSP
ncbi:MAG: carbon storage regulator [Planctomycetota bacterium]|nr:carbon storage regulator [Planctomycetota bacterium]